MTLEKIAYRKSEMQRAFLSADCSADPSLVLDIQARCSNARQRKDAHVVASAIGSGASVIVTDNIRDFAPAILSHYGLRKMRPEAFVLHLLEVRPAETLVGLREHRISMKKGQLCHKGYLAFLDKELGLPRLSKTLSAVESDT